MLHYGLIGCPLQHSLSPMLYSSFFKIDGIEAEYSLFSMEFLQDMHLFASEHLLGGFNVTLPYKELIVQQLDEIDGDALSIGAVNCVKVYGNGKLKGYNTDAVAFRDTLQPLLQPWHGKALVLGTGGASSAVCYALKQLDIPYYRVSRTKRDNITIGYDEAVKLAMQDYNIIVNATPVGMSPRVGETPWCKPECFSSRYLVYDLVYNPSQSLLLSQAAERGAVVCNGMAMLQGQAKLSWKIWKTAL